jgi:putative endonuclease
MHFVYILRCADGSFYVGSTSDPETREAIHNSGRGALHTRLRRPVRLIFTEPFATEAAAVTRERQLKRWTRAKKEALVDGDFERLRRS